MSGDPTIRIEPVETRSQRTEFVELPYGLLGRRQHWVPPLRRDVRRLIDPKVHPFHKHAEVALFLARRPDGKAVGRIAAIHNTLHNKHHRDKVGFFGFLDAEDDLEVFQALLDRAAEWVFARGCDTLRGPCSFSTNEECGLLVEGFDRWPSVMMPWTPPYYMRRIEELGAKSSMGLLSYWMEQEDLTERLFRLADGARKRLERQFQLVIRYIDIKRWDEELRIVQRLYNRAWSDNWGFVPMTDEEIAFMARDMRQVLDPRLVLIVELDGRPAGFSLALPDVNIILAHMDGRLGPASLLKAMLLKRSIRSFRLMALGVDPEFRKRGVDVLLYGETSRRGIAIGYLQAEFSWVLEANREMNRAMEAIGARVIRRHRLYEWPIDSAGKRIEERVPPTGEKQD